MNWSARTDSTGRAYAGSQRQIQAYVNEFPDQLSSAVASSIPEWAGQEVHLHLAIPLANVPPLISWTVEIRSDM